MGRPPLVDTDAEAGIEDTSADERITKHFKQFVAGGDRPVIPQSSRTYNTLRIALFRNKVVTKTYIGGVLNYQPP